jgi:hypothetical protein
MADDLLEVARAIRPFLTDLAGEDASALDAELGALLKRAKSGENIDESLRAALTRTPDVHRWAAAMLADPGLRPPGLETNDRGLSRLPGHPGTVQAPRFSCPQRDYVWYQRSAEMTPPKCPTHGLAVEPD